MRTRRPFNALKGRRKFCAVGDEKWGSLNTRRGAAILTGKETLHMTADMKMDEEGRIVSIPGVCHGKPVVRGTRIMVWLILEYLANGDSIEDVLAAYPDLTREDVQACLSYASRAARERIVPMEIGPHAF